jgi:hypothetical protein
MVYELILDIIVCYARLAGKMARKKSDQCIGGGTTEFGKEKSYRSRDISHAPVK